MHNHYDCCKEFLFKSAFYSPVSHMIAYAESHFPFRVNIEPKFDTYYGRSVFRNCFQKLKSLTNLLLDFEYFNIKLTSHSGNAVMRFEGMNYTSMKIMLLG